MILLYGGNKCSGKTTTLSNSAILFAKEYKTVLVETDKQLSLLKWHERRLKNKLSNPYDIVSVFDDDVAEKLISLNNKYELVMVDVAGVNGKAMIQALAVADISVINLESSIKSLETLKELETQFHATKKVNPKNTYLFLQTRTRDDFALSKKRNRFVDYCKDFKFGRVLDTIIFEKDSFVDSDVFGGTVFETKDTKAQNNIEKLCEEISNAE